MSNATTRPGSPPAIISPATIALDVDLGNDKEAVIARINGVHSGGSTDLSAGYLRGLREVRRVAQHGGTMLVVSDGHVNAGGKNEHE